MVSEKVGRAGECPQISEREGIPPPLHYVKYVMKQQLGWPRKFIMEEENDKIAEYIPTMVAYY